MSLWDDFEAEARFAHDFPFGVPCDKWTSFNRETGEFYKIPLTEMSESHIRNCMRLVGEDDGWYSRFEQELQRRTNNE